MENGTFVRRLVFALYFIVISTLFVVAGVAGLLGSAVQVWLAAKVASAQQLYLENKIVFDWSILILGSSIPAVTGVLAILKGYYYSERNLPIRLHELVEDATREHSNERPALLAYVRQPIDRDEFLIPPIYSNPFARLLRIIGYSTPHYRAKEFACSVDLLAEEVKIFEAKKAEIENRKVTGHLIRGAHFSARAAKYAEQTAEWRQEVETSLAEYKAALKIRGNDLDALEGAAGQYRALGNDAEELSILTKISDRHEDKPLNQARALRQAATIHDRRNAPKEWELARSRLVKARELLEHRLIFGQPEVLEMAKTELLFGEVQTKREKFSAARDALDHAAKLFGTICSAEGEQGRALVAEASKRLEVAARDKESPGL